MTGHGGHGVGRWYITRKLLLQPPTALTMIFNRCKFIVVCNSIPLTVSNGQEVMQSEKKNELPVKFYLFVSLKSRKNFLRFVGNLSFTKDRIKLDLLQAISCTTTELF